MYEKHNSVVRTIFSDVNVRPTNFEIKLYDYLKNLFITVHLSNYLCI